MTSKNHQIPPYCRAPAARFRLPGTRRRSPRARADARRRRAHRALPRHRVHQYLGTSPERPLAWISDGQGRQGDSDPHSVECAPSLGLAPAVARAWPAVGGLQQLREQRGTPTAIQSAKTKRYTTTRHNMAQYIHARGSKEMHRWQARSQHDTHSSAARTQAHHLQFSPRATIRHRKIMNQRAVWAYGLWLCGESRESSCLLARRRCRWRGLCMLLSADRNTLRDANSLRCNLHCGGTRLLLVHLHAI